MIRAALLAITLAAPWFGAVYASEARYDILSFADLAGAPVWVEKDREGPVRRLMIAQDTEPAINCAQRGDLFMGRGDAASRMAGRMLVLQPIQGVCALAAEGL